MPKTVQAMNQLVRYNARSLANIGAQLEAWVEQTTDSIKVELSHRYPSEDRLESLQTRVDALQSAVDALAEIE